MSDDVNSAFEPPPYAAAETGDQAESSAVEGVILNPHFY
jgi:hypothetical protein